MSEHVTKDSVQENGEVRTECSCGASWTHPKSRPMPERLSINDAHKSYGQRMKSVVL